jgi:hypothetical protein
VAGPFDALAKYERHHLVYHLAESGRQMDLTRLLCLETAEGLNAWFELRDGTGEADMYLADLDASRAAARSLPDLAAAELLVRASLAESSVVSRAGQIPPPLLAQLVADEEWGLDQAAAYARGIRHPGLRSEALTLLAARATDRRHRDLMEEALQAVAAIKGHFNWYEARLPAIAEVLPQEVVRLILPCPAESARFAALRASAPYLSLAAVRFALDAILPRRGQVYQAFAGPVPLLFPGVSGEKGLCEALISLIVQLPPAERLGVARLAEEAMTDNKGRVLTGVAAACGSPEDQAELLATAIEMAKSCAPQAPAASCLTLARAAPLVAPHARAEHVLDVIRRMEGLSDEYHYDLGEIIVALAAADPGAAARQLTRLPGAPLADTSARILRFLDPSAARELAASIDPDQMLDGGLLEAVVSRLDPPDVRRRVRLAKDKDEQESSLLLKVLVRHLPDDEALDAARALTEASARARVLASLVGRIDSRVLLRATSAVSDFPALVTTLASIAESCPAAADDIARLVLDDVVRRDALAGDGVAALRGLAPVLSEQAASAWLDLATDIATLSGDRLAHGLVAARLSPPAARRRIEAMSDAWEQYVARSILAGRLSGDEGLDLLSAFQPGTCGPGLTDLIMRHRHGGVTARFVDRARDLAATVEDPWQRACICALLLPVTDPPGQPAAALACVREAAQGLAGVIQRLAVIAFVQPWLCDDEAHQAVLDLLGQLDPGEQGRNLAWTILSDTIAPGPLRAAIGASATEPLYGQRDTLDPGPADPQPTLAEIQEWISLALDRLVSRHTGGYDPAAEAVVAHFLKPAGSADVSLQDAYDAVWRIGSDHLRARALALLLPHIAPHQQVEIGEQALELALQLPFVDLSGVRVGLPHPLRFWSRGLQDFTGQNRDQLLRQMLRRLGRRPRSDLFRAFAECGAVLAGSVPANLPAQVARWTVDAERWWR